MWKHEVPAAKRKPVLKHPSAELFVGRKKNTQIEPKQNPIDKHQNSLYLPHLLEVPSLPHYCATDLLLLAIEC